MSTVLITGGTGYIGSFTALAFLEAGYEVIIIDNLSQSSDEVLNRIELTCGKRALFYQVDTTDEKAIDDVFNKHPEIVCVIHFAGLKALGESSKDPLRYYKHNLYGTMVVLGAMSKHNVRNLLFSSSSTAYGDPTLIPGMIPVPEDCPLMPINPYGHTKVMGEVIIKNLFDAKNAEEKRTGSNEKWNAGLLRYFNPCGAHPNGIMGEDLRGRLHLIPALAQVALGKLPKLMFYGDDYETRDGTMIRDYIHVLDLAQGHIAALKHLQAANPGVRAWNFGSGRGETVIETLKAFGRAVGREIPSGVEPRRPEYVPDLTASTERAATELKWTADKTLEEACADFWFWNTNNPEGYAQAPPEHLLKAMKS